MNRLGGTTRTAGPVQVSVDRLRVPLSVVVTGWLWRRLAGLVVCAVRHPVVVLAVAVVVVAWRVTVARGPAPVASTVLGSAAGLILWRRAHPASFTRLVVQRALGWWRAATRYRYAWQPAMVTTGLAVRVDGVEYVPRLLSVRSTGTVDVVRVRMLPGQTVADWAANGPRLAQTFAAVDARIRSVPGRPQLVVLWFLRADPLTADIAPFPPPADGSAVDLAGLPVAVGEDGTIHRLRLLGAHVLVVGATSSGKGSVLWSILTAVAPAVRDGLVQVWAVDPKGGMELAPGRGLFHRFVYGDPDDATAHEVEFARVLEDAVAVMRRRQAVLRGVTRLHTPTTSEPLVVVVVDELASLTCYVVDRDAKRRIGTALSLLLSQGRAVGVSVVGAIQDPRKDVLSMRDLFPTRILLRVTEPDHVSLTLGHGARDRGARADLIPETSPGVGYVGHDGTTEAARVRFTHVTDQHIAAMAADYAPRPHAAVLAAAGPVHDRDVRDVA